MPFRSQFTVELTRVRQARDTHGDRTGATQELAFRAVVVPSSSQENLRTGDEVTTTQNVYPLDASVDVTATDRLRLPGETGAAWQVAGDPKRYFSPYSGKRVTEISIERATG